MNESTDIFYMRQAIHAGDTVRGSVSPRPWVGAVLVTEDEKLFVGATIGRSGGPHAEIVAIERAIQSGAILNGATLYVTLEPCAHQGSTRPCVDAILETGIRRIVVGVQDPDVHVSGLGILKLTNAGREVITGCCHDEIGEQLAPYLKQRSTKRPYVILKMGSTLDGGIAASDGTSQWITSEHARHDVQMLRAQSDAILVGSQTVISDDPSLTVRVTLGDLPCWDGKQPLRIVLGSIQADAKVLPALSWDGSLEDLLDYLGELGVLQLLVEGGAKTAHAFHTANLVDRYILYIAPAFFGGSNKKSLFEGMGPSSIDEIWRGTFHDVSQIGNDIRIDIRPPVSTK